MTLISEFMPHLLAWTVGLAFVVLLVGASAQSPEIDIDAELGLPTASDIDNELATRIAAEVEIELETNPFSVLEEVKSRRPNRAPSRKTLGFYDVQIDVQRDGSLEVTETIDAYALGQQIKRGIHLEFSLLNVERYRPSNPYDTISAKRDGVSISWFTEGGRSFYQVYMGTKNRRLKSGRWYTYEL